ncbi:MAG TPA: hypothetical protein VGF28_10240 [Thermoanaerobaculia bacterium]|jgi:TPR repeat protein
MLRVRAYAAAAIVVCAAAALLAGACGREGSQTACIADAIGTLTLTEAAPTCATDEAGCRANCAAGNGAACLGLAYDLEPDPKTAMEARRFYHRACLLGVANACTNYAAGVWARDHSDAESTCARRTFEKACAARDPFGCGMVGRVLLESTTPPRLAEGRKVLQEACDGVGGFPRRVLAKHLESGKLGQYDPQRIRTLLTRACEGGDPDACGEPATASETFR